MAQEHTEAKKCFAAVANETGQEWSHTLKPIVFYYSRSGRTEKLAHLAAKEMRAEIMRIEPEYAYGSFSSSISRVIKERVRREHPRSSTPIPDLSRFDPIFVGYPVWANDLPEFIGDFLSRCDLEGKTVIPFATFAVSGMEKSLASVTAACKGAQILYPFEDGMLRGGDYRKWRLNVRRYIWNME